MPCGDAACRTRPRAVRPAPPRPPPRARWLLARSRPPPPRPAWPHRIPPGAAPHPPHCRRPRGPRHRQGAASPPPAAWAVPAPSIPGRHPRTQPVMPCCDQSHLSDLTRITTSTFPTRRSVQGSGRWPRPRPSSGGSARHHGAWCRPRTLIWSVAKRGVAWVMVVAGVVVRR
jgi:hypothetical protein